MSEYTRWQRIKISLDQTVGQFLFREISIDETISAYCWRTNKTRWIKFIDWLFDEPGHCESSFDGQKGPLGLVRDKAEDAFHYGYTGENKQ